MRKIAGALPNPRCTGTKNHRVYQAPMFDPASFLATIEQRLRRTLARLPGRTRAAQLLGLSRDQVRYKVKKHELE